MAMMHRGLVRVAAMAAALLLSLTAARAQDKVTLKDGRVIEGVVVREEQGFVWIRVKYGSMEQEQMFAPDQIEKVERDAAAAPDPKSAPRGRPDAASPRHPGAPRAAVISVGEPDRHMVGVYVVAQVLHEAIPLLEEENIDVVALRIASGGGYTFEVQRLSDVIHNEYKQKFRTVGWIESAISAAAMTAHCLPELYFMPQGHYGACTEFSGALVATKDRPLEERLFQMEKISARGGYDPLIMRSMQIMEPLSCTIDASGDVHWYPNLSGQYIVNPEGRILTFNSEQALKYKFAKGIAQTCEELGKLLGYQELEWVGENIKGIPYPVCKAEKFTREFRRRTATDEKNINLYFANYQAAIALAQGAQDRKDRGKFVGIARGWLTKIEAMVRNNNNLGVLLAGTVERFKEWVEEQHQLLRDLMR